MTKMKPEEYIEFQDALFEEMKTLTKAKNQDYTAGSGDPFANFRESEGFGVDTLRGLCIRMGDKFQRIKAYMVNGELAVANEGLEDAFKDLIGYSCLALGLLEEQKTITFETDMAVCVDIPSTVAEDDYTTVQRRIMREQGGEDVLRSTPSWDEAPEWANWLAQDADGEWGWFEKQPLVDLGVECWSNNRGDYAEAGCYSPPKDFAKTLQERPE